MTQPSTTEKQPDAFASSPTESYSVTKDLNAYEESKNKLEVWETLNSKKFVNEVFDIHNIGGEFMVKMQTAKINKFVMGEMEERGWDKTTDNYKAILQEYESEIGTERLPLFERFKKLNGYIQAIKKLRDAKKRVGTFKPYVRED